jgi:hypothetical protein
MGYRSGIYPLPACTGYPALESCDGSPGGACVSNGYWVDGGRETWGAGIGLGEWATLHADFFPWTKMQHLPSTGCFHFSVSDKL